MNGLLATAVVRDSLELREIDIIYRTHIDAARRCAVFLFASPEDLYAALFTKKMFEGVELLVIVANNVNKGLFREFKGRIIKWEIPDADESEKEKITRIIGDIERRVKNLINELNN